MIERFYKVKWQYKNRTRNESYSEKFTNEAEAREQAEFLRALSLRNENIEVFKYKVYKEKIE